MYRVFLKKARDIFVNVYNKSNQFVTSKEYYTTLTQDDTTFLRTTHNTLMHTLLLEDEKLLKMFKFALVFF